MDQILEVDTIFTLQLAGTMLVLTVVTLAMTFKIMMVKMFFKNKEATSTFHFLKVIKITQMVQLKLFKSLLERMVKLLK